jgi:hypothetical protein
MRGGWNRSRTPWPAAWPSQGSDSNAEDEMRPMDREDDEICRLAPIRYPKPWCHPPLPRAPSSCRDGGCGTAKVALPWRVLASRLPQCDGAAYHLLRGGLTDPPAAQQRGALLHAAPLGHLLRRLRTAPHNAAYALPLRPSKH